MTKVQGRIANNAKAFQILARQYSDPITTIVRELSSNAIDAHRRVGSTEPFEIYAPTHKSPQLKIRDYGCSMSHEKMVNVFVEYTNSDKAGTDEIGHFGLGSKTPLAYTHINHFNITTYLDGVRRNYTFGYNEKGIPELTLHETVKTDQKNGVEITLDVAPKDIDAFQQAIKSVYSFFTVPFTVHNIQNFETVKPQPVLQGDDWMVYGGSSHYIVIDQIAYPINDLISRRIDYITDLRFGYKTIVYVDKCEVDITPSREQLEYTDKTQEYLIQLNNKITQKISKYCHDLVGEAKTKWQAEIVCSRLHKYLHGELLPFIPNSIYLPYNWKAVEYSIINAELVKQINTRLIVPEENIRIFIKDERYQLTRRIEAYLKEHPSHRILLVPDVSVEDVKQKFKLSDQDNIIHKISDLPRQKVVRKKKTGVSKNIQCMQIYPIVQQTEIKDEGTIVYIDKPRSDYVCRQLRSKMHAYMGVIKQLNKGENVELPCVYAITKTNLKKIKHGTPVHVQTWLRQEYEKVKDKVPSELLIPDVYVEYLIQYGNPDEYADVPRTLCIIRDISAILRKNNLHKQIRNLLCFIYSNYQSENHFSDYISFVLDKFKSEYPVCHKMLSILPRYSFSMQDQDNKPFVEQMKRLLQQDPI